MLSWASRFNICCFLDNHRYQLPAHSIECLLGAGAHSFIEAGAGNAFDRLEAFSAHHRDWLFGHFGYGLAAETEPAAEMAHAVPEGGGGADRKPAKGADEVSGRPKAADPGMRFPDLYFFVPAVVIELRAGSMRIGSLTDDPEVIFEAICGEAPEGPSGGLAEAAGRIAGMAGGDADHGDTEPVAGDADTGGRPGRGSEPAGLAPLRARFSRDEYLQTIRALREHILRGDCYEINFCQEFYSYPADVDPLQTWQALSDASPNPFSAFYRLDDQYLFCASPERYLQRTGDTLRSQPIKGTSARKPGNAAADKASRDALFLSAKDRSENVMVVDLVRNDLSRICLPDSVRVEELYGIYSFPQVHQMISSITGKLGPGIGLAGAVRATFPMGSMTGAPKNRVVQLIQRYERSRRGLFSGAVGYMTPEGDFDLNVVIRSILYNREERYLSYLVGSGITWYSDPALEYEECLLKAEGIQKALRIPKSF